MKRKTAFRILGIALVICLAAGAAWSVQTLRLATFTVAPQGGAAAAAPVCIDLSSAAGNQSILNFGTPASRVVIRFTAECSVGGPQVNYLNTDIIVDPAGAGAPFAVPPTDSDLALCSGNGTATQNDGWVSASVQAYASLPAGVHTVQVCVNGIGAGSIWRVDDTSLTIESDP